MFVPLKIICGNLMFNLTALGNEVSGKCIGREVGAFINGISGLIKDPVEFPKARSSLHNESGSTLDIPALDFAALRTLRTKCLFLISQPVYDIFF